MYWFRFNCLDKRVQELIQFRNCRFCSGEKKSEPDPFLFRAKRLFLVLVLVASRR